MLELPKYEYVLKEGIIYTTLRQQVLHCIGMDGYTRRHRPYTRHGRKFFRPWRNFFSTLRNDKTWESLVGEGYADKTDHETRYTQNGEEHVSEGTTYWLTRKGLDWLGEQLGITIYDEEA